MIALDDGFRRREVQVRDVSVIKASRPVVWTRLRLAQECQGALKSANNLCDCVVVS
jgi:hypothetical protein